MAFRKFIYGETLDKFLDSVPEEHQLKWYKIIKNYGLYEIEPELVYPETTAWVGIKEIIDNTMPIQDKDVSEARAEAGRRGMKARWSNDNKTDFVITNDNKDNNDNKTDFVITNDNKDNNDNKTDFVITNDNKDNNDNKTANDNDNDNVNVNVNDNLSHMRDSSDNTSRESDCFISEPDFDKIEPPDKLLIALWQSSDLINPVASICEPQKWRAFWATSPPTRQEVLTAWKNFEDGIKNGEIEPKFKPSSPDNFAFKWLKRLSKPFGSKHRIANDMVNAEDALKYFK